MIDDIHKGSGCLKCPVNRFDCDAQYRDSRCAALRAKAGADFDPKTNADRIRSMNDEDLGKWLFRWMCKNIAGFIEKGGAGCMNASELEDWLQQPAEEQTV